MKKLSITTLSGSVVVTAKSRKAAYDIFVSKGYKVALKDVHPF